MWGFLEYFPMFYVCVCVCGCRINSWCILIILIGFNGGSRDGVMTSWRHLHTFFGFLLVVVLLHLPGALPPPPPPPPSPSPSFIIYIYIYIFFLNSIFFYLLNFSKRCILFNSIKTGAKEQISAESQSESDVVDFSPFLSTDAGPWRRWRRWRRRRFM